MSASMNDGDRLFIPVYLGMMVILLLRGRRPYEDNPF